MKINLKISEHFSCSHNPTLQHLPINNNKNLIINNLYIEVAVGTSFFCWNTLEHLFKEQYKVRFSVGAKKCSNKIVGTLSKSYLAELVTDIMIKQASVGTLLRKNQNGASG